MRSEVYANMIQTFCLSPLLSPSSHTKQSKRFDFSDLIYLIIINLPCRLLKFKHYSNLMRYFHHLRLDFVKQVSIQLAYVRISEASQ